MTLSISFVFLALTVCAFAAFLPQSLNLTEPLTSNTDVSTDDDLLRVTCSAPLYGQNLRVSSCKDIFDYMSRDTSQSTFAERNSMVPYDLPLPYRTQSKDGFCYVQVVLAPGARSGRASPYDVGSAALTLLNQCAKKYGYGGVASMIGGDNNLKVIMSSYKPHVVCKKRPSPPWRSAVKVFADMPASKELAVFGRVGAPGIDYELPFVVKAIDARAMIKVDSDGRSARAKWYEIWEAVNAVAYMCINQKKEGGATRIGSLGNIRVDFLDEHPDLAQILTDAQNISLGLDLSLPQGTTGHIDGTPIE